MTRYSFPLRPSSREETRQLTWQLRATLNGSTFTCTYTRHPDTLHLNFRNPLTPNEETKLQTLMRRFNKTPTEWVLELEKALQADAAAGVKQTETVKFILKRLGITE